EVEGAFKLGVNGYDNEADFAIDHYLRIDESNFVSFIFGAIQQGDFLNDGIYDEYILETSEGPVVVRSGGTEGDMTNIIFDGDFTSDVLPDSWTFFEGEGAVADFSVIDNEAAVTNISGAGGATWHLQLIQLLSPEQKDMLTVGETYEISFDARSSVDGRPFRLFFGEDGGAFTGLAVVDTVANTAMQTYTYYTTLTQIFDNMKLGFELGLSNDDFFVDNVSMTRVEGVAEPLFGSNDVVGFLGETNELSFDLVELGSETIESFEFELTYDPTLVDITVPDQFGTLAENFTVEVNAETPGTILVSAAGTQGITDTGTLFVFDVLGLDNGEGSLEFTNVVYNETYVPGFSSALSIFEFICGDVTGDGQISAMDASWVLRHTVKLAPQYPLVGADSSAADVTGNGWISAFDASQILKYNVGLPAIFSCSESQAKAAPLAINAEWDYTPPAETQSIISMPIKISEINAELTAAQIEVPIAEGLAFKGLRNTPENWQVTTNVNDGTAYISLFGVKGIQQELLGALEFEVLNNSRPLSISASVTLNENAPVQLKEVNLFELPSEFELSQNYPNPFNPTTQIKYSVPHDAKVQLTVYNLLGQKVAELVNEQKSPGKYTISWDAGNNASGVYMYRLAAGNKVFTKKMMLIK
ncbi:MAG: T9SS type A sorting domain-containing protein, partial [Gracilimonas sp.]|nr:T9SS type A sorting domain-containing protein [Gracilimonas sp.]